MSKKYSGAVSHDAREVAELRADRDLAVEYLKAAMPLQRLGTVDEIGQVAVFLASPLASYVSGTVVVVDGGQNLPGSALFNLGAEQMLRAMPRK